MVRDGMGVKNFYWSILIGLAGRSKNGRRNFKLILSCYCPIFSPHAKFHPYWTKNTEVRNFHFWSVLVGWAGRSKNGRSHFKHSIAVWKVMNDPCTKFELNRMKNTEVENFHYWSVLVGRAGWSKNGCSHFKHSESLDRLTKFETKSDKNWQS